MNQLYMLMIISAFGGAIVTALAFMAAKLRYLGTSWVITLGEVPGSEGKIERLKLTKGYWDRKAPDDEKERSLATGLSAYPSRKGPIHVMTSYGANLVAPTRQEAAATIEAMVIKEWAENHKRLPQSGDKEALAQQFQAAFDKAAKIATRFLIHDPLTYWRKGQEKLMEDLYNAQSPKDPWQVRMIPMLAIAVVALAGVIGLGMWKLLPLLQHAAATAGH